MRACGRRSLFEASPPDRRRTNAPADHKFNGVHVQCTCIYMYTPTVLTCSPVPRPPPQLLSLAVRKAQRRPGRVSHVMCAAADVTNSVNTYSQYSTCYRLFQRHYRNQTNSRGEAGPTYTTYLDLKQNR